MHSIQNIFQQAQVFQSFKQVLEHHKNNPSFLRQHVFIAQKSYVELFNFIFDFDSLEWSFRNLGVHFTKQLVDEKIFDVNFQNQSGHTSLHRTIKEKNPNNAFVSFLLTFDNINPNIRNLNGDTPLITAAELGLIEILSLLINCNKTNLNLQNNVTEVLSSPIMVNLVGISPIVHTSNDYIIKNRHNSPLIVAISNSHYEAACILASNEEVHINLRSFLIPEAFMKFLVRNCISDMCIHQNTQNHNLIKLITILLNRTDVDLKEVEFDKFLQLKLPEYNGLVKIHNLLYKWANSEDSFINRLNLIGIQLNKDAPLTVKNIDYEVNPQILICIFKSQLHVDQQLIKQYGIGYYKNYIAYIIKNLLELDPKYNVFEAILAHNKNPIQALWFIKNFLDVLPEISSDQLLKIKLQLEDFAKNKGEFYIEQLIDSLNSINMCLQVKESYQSILDYLQQLEEHVLTVEQLVTNTISLEIDDTSYTEDTIKDLDNQLCSENNELKLLGND